MIADVVSNIEQYFGISPYIDTALRYIRDTDFSLLPDGRQEIDGDLVFANIMSYTPAKENRLPESHKKYIDLQYLIMGQELVGVAPLSDMLSIAEAHPERDIWLNRGDTEKLTIGNGRFLLLFPGDAHAPGIDKGDGVSVRKCVVKIVAPTAK